MNGESTVSDCRRHYLGLFVMVWILIFASLTAFGWTETWRYLGVPTLTPIFHDLRAVQAAGQALELGLNPQIENPLDPWGRVMNYPLIWANLSWLFNLQNENLFLFFGFLLVGGYLLCTGHLLYQYPSIGTLLLPFSGASLLAIERGNTDLAAFIVLYLASQTLRLDRRMLLVTLAGVVKLFPLAAFAGFVRNRKDLMLAGVATAFVIGLNWSAMDHLRNGTPTSSAGFGIVSLAITLENLAGAGSRALPLLILVSLAALLFRAAGPIGNEPSKPRVMFLIGAAVYVGCFVLIGSNADYRMIVLSLCAPYVFSNPSPLVRSGGGVTLLLAPNMAGIYNLTGIYGGLISHVARLILFAWLAAELVSPLLPKTKEAK